MLVQEKHELRYSSSEPVLEVSCRGFQTRLRRRCAAHTAPAFGRARLRFAGGRRVDLTEGIPGVLQLRGWHSRPGARGSRRLGAVFYSSNAPAKELRFVKLCEGSTYANCILVSARRYDSSGAAFPLQAGGHAEWTAEITCLRAHGSFWKEGREDS